MNIETQPIQNSRTSLYGFEMREVDNRRALPNERKTYNIKQLWQRNHEILRLTLIGMSECDIATQLNITSATVSNTINSELGTKKLSTMREKRDEDIIDVAKEVAKMLPKALDIYDSILTGKETTKLQKETADTLVMDIGGYRAPTKIHSENAHLYLTPDDVEKLKERGIKAARDSGMLAE